MLAFAPTLQWTSIANYLVPGDFGVLPFVGLGFLSRDRRDAPQNRLRRRLVAPAVVIATGSIASLVDIGLTSWALSTLIRDVFVTLSFLGLLAYARSRRLPEQWITVGAAAAGLFVAAFVLIQGGYRPAATFGQVNMTGHFLATCFVLIVARAPMKVRLTTLPIIVAAVVRTSSFGALLSIGVVMSYLGYGVVRRRLHRSPALLAFLLWATVMGAGGLIVRSAATTALSNADSGAALSDNRLERTSNNRGEIWLDGLRALKHDPLGIGPGGFKPLNIHPKITGGVVDAAEIHHDFLGYIVERGFIGVAGLVMLYAVLWRTGRPWGATRGLLVMNLVSGFFRETLHFRHLWIFLALTIAHELGESRDLAAERKGLSRLRTVTPTGRTRVGRSLGSPEREHSPRVQRSLRR